MFNRGLSLDQAPPISVIMRFFLTIPLFGLLASGALFFADSQTVLYWDSPGTAAIVHLLLLGVAGMAMVGALFQMLPVIAGAAIKKPLFHSFWIHALMVLGTLMLTGALFFDIYILLHPAMMLLAGSLGFVVYLMLGKLFAVENKTPSVKGMILSISSLGIGLLFAILLTLSFLGVNLGVDPLVLRSIHIHFMLPGWIGILVMGVAFQVIEMFYVTPPYPKRVTSLFPGGIFLLLLLYAVISALFVDLVPFIDGALALLFMGFGAVTLLRLSQRKRPVADATVWLWRLSMGSLVISSFLAIISATADSASLFSVSALLFAYFLLSVIFAMSYKIVPFLVWFHLNAKGVMQTPMMGDIIPAKMAMRHLWIHLALLAAGFSLAVTPYGWKLIAALLAAEFLLYGANLLRAVRIYQSLKGTSMYPEDKGIL